MLPHVETTPLAERVAPALRPCRLGAALFSAFGLLALLLARLGLYGVVAYDVVQRRRELGIRFALGASTRSVLWMVLEDAGRVVGAGLLIGVVAAAYAARYVEPLLFEVSGRDPFVLACVASLLMAAGLLAAAVPAWRAAHTHPTEALRDE